jgi:hypothetical protein
MNHAIEKQQSLIDFYPIGVTRRNHGLEHATLHVLGARHPRQSLAGHSDPGGFWIVGNISADEVRSAVAEAQQRLLNGEPQLAVHPNCGTNFVVTGTLAGAAGALAMFGAGRRFRDKVERLPLAMTLATLALIVAQPLGLTIQSKVTTSADVSRLAVVEIRTTRRGRMQAHRVVTREIA